jgi:hypothetical protein
MASTAAGGVVETTSQADIAAVNPVIKVNGSVIPYGYGQRVWHTAGIQPGKATLWLSGNGEDSTGPVTLGKHAFGIKRFDPLTVSDGQSTIFAGLILERLDQGENNAVMWEAHDWRWLLQWIPVTGCLVWDEVAGAVKYIQRFTCRMNPGGRWNCIIKGGIPVFTHLASESTEAGTYDQSIYDTTDRADVVCPWTPARAMRYLNYCANIGEGDVVGIETYTWRTLKDSTHLDWPTQADIPGVEDNFYSILPDTTLDGKSMAGAIDALMKLSGVIDLSVTYNADSCVMFFFATKLSTTQKEQVSSSTIPLARGGTATDANTAFDFDLRESGVKQAAAVAVLGAPARVETSLTYDPANPGTSTLALAFTASEIAAFKTMVDGVLQSGTRYAYKPASIPADGDWSAVTYTAMDGTGGNPKIIANTMAAVQLARSYMRKAWRAFKINVPSLISASIQEGVGGAFAAKAFLNTPRAVLLEQLQHMVSEYATDKLLKARCQISIMVGDGAGAMYPTLANDGLQVDDDGTLLFAGLTEESGAATDCVYLGTLTTPTGLAMKKVSINVAFPLDFRTTGVSAQSLASSIDAELGGPPLIIRDEGDSYPVEHQMASTPIPYLAKLPGAYGGTEDSVPVTRVLKDESARATKSADRLREQFGQPEISSQWSMIGIRSEYGVGGWIADVQPIGSSPGGDPPYTINAPVKTVLFDFDNQITVIGGLLHSSVGPQKIEGGKRRGAPGVLAKIDEE